MRQLSRWSSAIALVLVAVVVLVVDSGWNLAVASAAAVVLLLLAWVSSPLFGRGGTRFSELRAVQDEERIVIFWQPSCSYCLRLKASLGRVGRQATWVNIWADADAAAFVRSHNGGNETVPTVLMGGQVLTNPAPSMVRDALRNAALGKAALGKAAPRNQEH